MAPLDWPLMHNNIGREDVDAVTAFLQDGLPVLTQSSQVAAFEREWSEWLGVRHSVFVNSGSSANLVTMFALKERYGVGEVIVPALTWVSDIASVLHAGLLPVVVDVRLDTLGMDTAEVVRRITPRTRAVFLTHILGYNALDGELLSELEARGIALVEDVCESHGATFEGRKLGTFGLASNFSFYYAHHMTTIEGGMICTDDERLYQDLRMYRSHGMVRECSTADVRAGYHERFPDLNPDFIFAYPGFNVRSTEINAVMGRRQLKSLDANNERRRENLRLFLSGLDPDRFFTGFRTEGSCNYAFTLILCQPDLSLRDSIERMLREERVEFRRGTSGGGNQLRQPYLREQLGESAWKLCPRADHVHFFGWYIGNYPDLPEEKIHRLVERLNGIGR
jgi:CDP-4-dehydro-6-deoxyglucose reductase, E1